MNLINQTFTGFQGETITVISFFEKSNMYQCESVSGNIKTNPLLSESDINDLIQAQSKINESLNQQQEYNKQQQEQKRQEEQEESIGNFHIDNPKRHAKAKETLNTLVRYGKGNYMTRKEFIHSKINTDYKPIIDNKGKYILLNDKTNEFHFITKTEYDYFNYLTSESAAV